MNWADKYNLGSERDRMIKPLADQDPRSKPTFPNPKNTIIEEICMPYDKPE